ncbi:uncharacterized protein K452DRAFT_292585 [Aplosporella prunicola CBS 121167]|uniref:DlpA domain-containing protein n=1 Tax=Aplosporella prunicola CBS 121167 TaxID=1176127 RepID=A0A6A6AX81_9PEZI|nr:uncharacterized protein K452DRAFT_292585 [Aplosporella prunicola CBS 121167]KAF2136216.1 hypothetical protein K452DRAFT_292585 [Aplosporella prunicola CBS 121167]
MSIAQLEALAAYSACDVCDALLKLQVPGAGFLADIAPISTPTNTTQTRTIAPASTILFAPSPSPSFPNRPTPNPAVPTNQGTPLPAGTPYADAVSDGTIVVLSQPADQTCAVVGGINAVRMARRGVQGILVSGRVRDLEALRDVQEEDGVPVWARGGSAVGAGAQAKAVVLDADVRVGECVVGPGDIIMLDPTENAAVVIPLKKLDEALELLPRLVEADEKVMKDVKAGGTVGEAFAKYRGK